MPFRFVHTADIHLDSPLKSLALRDPDLAEMIGGATRSAFSRIIDLCLSERVDALLIAGDLYDGDQTSMRTALFLARELARLDDAGIACFIIRGNHDNVARITRELELPKNVHVFDVQAGAILLERHGAGPDIAIHGLSFRDAKAPDSLLPLYRPPVEGAFNIGMMHTSLNGSPGHDPYAPCSVTELQASGFGYWALGHIHQRAQHDGRTTVVMPGIPQGRDINEAGEKSVSLVTVGDGGEVRVEERSVAAARFERVALNLDGVMEWSELTALIGRGLEQALSGQVDQHRVVRLRLYGSTPMAWRIRRELDLLKTQADFYAGRIGRVSVEKLESTCLPLETKSADSGDPVSELEGLISSEVLTSHAFMQEASDTIEDLLKALPPELRSTFGQEHAEQVRRAGDLAAEGVELVLARLRDTGEKDER